MEINNINRPHKGLNLDSSSVDQPKGTYRFALNSISETTDGDKYFLSNEKGNIDCTELPEGFIIIGNVYLQDDESAIFLTNDTDSIIATIDKDCNYVEHVRSSCLNFKKSNQIDATYRLRQGCERVIYFTDGLNPPRIFNFEQPEDFQLDNPTTDEIWDCDQFNLITTYNNIPCFFEAEIQQGGNIASGSYNFGIQLLDEDLNATNVIYTSQTVNIYTINEGADYNEINGSENEGNDTLNAELFAEQNANKSIKLTITNIDQSFPFYKIIVIRAISGTGQVTDALASPEISSSQSEFIYTGNTTGYTEITTQEIAQQKIDITSAEHIDQIENRLILANTKGVQYDYCSFQSFASKIESKYVIKKVPAFDIVDGNNKDGTTPFDSLGFMADEVYAVGIVYVDKFGNESPVMHIPGKPIRQSERQVITTWNENIKHIYSDPDEYNNLPDDEKLQRWQVENTGGNPDEDGLGEMAAWESTQGIYEEDRNCNNQDFWGRDSKNFKLVNKPVRHHKFPSRSQVPLIEYNGDDTVIQNTTIRIVFSLIPIDTGEVDENGDPIFEEQFPPGEDRVDYTITYTLNGQTQSIDGFLLDDDFPFEGATVGETIVTIQEGDVFDINSVTVSGEISNFTDFIEWEITTQNSQSILSSDTFINVLGIELCNIEYPHPNIIGHYIVIGDRDDQNRTIFDKGFANPLRQNNRYTTFSYYINNIGRDPQPDLIYCMNPKNLYLNDSSTAGHINIEGYYRRDQNFPVVGNTGVIQDAADGTTSRGAFFGLIKTDKNGISWTAGYRWLHYNYDNFQPAIHNFPIIRNLNLKPVQKRTAFKDDKTLYNTTLDNKTEIFELDSDLFPIGNLDDRSILDQYSLKYISLKRENDVHPFLENIRYRRGHNCLQTSNCSRIFGGDTYVSYTSLSHSTYYGLDSPRRWGEVLSNIIGIVVLAVLTVVSAGTLAGVAAGAIVAATVATAVLGVAAELFQQFYKDFEQEGLKDMVFDSQLNAEVDDLGKRDDTMKYVAEHLSGLFVESEIPVGLRSRSNTECAGFIKESSESSIRTYITDKYIYREPDRDYKDSVRSIPCPEIYVINRDYLRLNWEKIYFSLPRTYDCCTDCLEEFPNRVYYSEQSFQEEVSDFFRIFLPNNFRDVEAEHGPITDIFRMRNNLYVHTAEALWHLPQNVQERVTNEIVSFLGTGDFFSIPPRKVIDSDIGSGGTINKWATTKTRHGVLFISEIEEKIYLLTPDGQVQEISRYGLKNWFENNIKLTANDDYYKQYRENFPLRNNPANDIGIGFHSTYDTRHNRFILTKKDYQLDPEVLNPDLVFCEGNWIQFEDIEGTIAEQESQGFTYLGIQNCKLSFEKETETEIIENIPNNTDVHVFYDTSGSFTGAELADTRSAVADWFADLPNQVDNFTGTLYEYDDKNERWLGFIQRVANTYGGNLTGRNILLVTFINESANVYHSSSGSLTTVSNPTTAFNDDFATFSNLYNQAESFIGIHYPIPTASGTFSSRTKQFLLHSAAALNEIPSPQNPAFTTAEWNDLLSALNNNPYVSNLSNFGWSARWDRFNNNGEVIDPAQFATDVNDILQGTQEIVIELEVETVEIEGTVIPQEEILTGSCDKSWTISFSIDDNSWTSWHSYLPNFYIHTPNHFYSFITSNNNLWRHNEEFSFQRFYGILYDHIIEYVSLSNPLKTRIWNDLTIQTDAKKYSEDHECFLDERFITHNSITLYNTRQNSGELKLKVKDDTTNEYLLEQTTNSPDEIIITREERNWNLNDFRDIVIDYNTPMFIKKCQELQDEYYIDKIINPNSIDYFKDWYELASFRDKFLIIRLKFSNFDNVQLVTNYMIETEQDSFR